MKPKTILPLAAASLMALFIVAVILLADTASLGILRRISSFPYGDKVGHFVLYGLLSLLLSLAILRLMPQQPAKRLVVLTSFALGLMIAAEELSQVWLPSRSADWLDLVASFAGVAFSSAIVLRWAYHGHQRIHS